MAGATRLRRLRTRLRALVGWLLLGTALTWVEASLECVLNVRYPVVHNVYNDGIRGRIAQYYLGHIVDTCVYSGRPDNAPPTPDYIGSREVREARERYHSEIGPVARVFDGWQAHWASAYVWRSSPHQQVTEDGSPMWTDVSALRYGWPSRCWSAWHLELKGSPLTRLVCPVLGFEYDYQQPLLGIPAGWYRHGLDSDFPGQPIRPRLLPIIPTIHLLVPNAMLYAAGAWLLRRGPRLGLRAFRRRQGRCSHCGYSRAGLPAATPCPECGVPVAIPSEPTRAPASPGE